MRNLPMNRMDRVGALTYYCESRHPFQSKPASPSVGVGSHHPVIHAAEHSAVSNARVHHAHFQAQRFVIPARWPVRQRTAANTVFPVANQSGNASYAAASTGTQSFNVTALAQTISFPAIADRTLGSAPFSVSATASSGLPVSIASLTTTVCSISGNTVTLLTAGLCTLEASQPGDSQYSAAPSLMQIFSVNVASSVNDGDVPLPPWALLLLGAGLLAAMRRRAGMSR